MPGKSRTGGPRGEFESDEARRYWPVYSVWPVAPEGSFSSGFPEILKRVQSGTVEVYQSLDPPLDRRSLRSAAAAQRLRPFIPTIRGTALWLSKRSAKSPYRSSLVAWPYMEGSSIGPEADQTTRNGIGLCREIERGSEPNW
jgi:hypothetical protein